MKTAPADLDREAARMFMPVQGMRVMVTEWPGRDAWATVLGHSSDVFIDWGPWSTAPESQVRTLRKVHAIDTDDPATVGCMLAQVEAMNAAASVSIIDRLHAMPGEDDRRFMVIVGHDGSQAMSVGPTRGAALVAAMRALKGAK